MRETCEALGVSRAMVQKFECGDEARTYGRNRPHAARRRCPDSLRVFRIPYLEWGADVARLDVSEAEAFIVFNRRLVSRT